MRRSLLFWMCPLLLAAGSTAAGPRPEKRAEPFQAVLDCRGVADAAARLACFDAAAAKMGSAEAHGEIVVIDQAQARAANEQAFGLSLPSLGFLTRGLAPDEFDRMQGVVRDARPDALGKWTIVLSDGAVWRQISSEMLSRDPKPGTKVSIRRASLGSYMMNIDGQAAIRVHRDQ